MDYKLELVLIPVSDVDRAKAFYLEKLGFDLLIDTSVGDGMRVVQLTPPGSACSIGFGTGLTKATPGSAEGLHLVVPDVDAARAELVERGLDVGEMFHMGEGGQAPGPDPERRDYNSFLPFSDPDGNTWLVQEVRRTASQA